MMKSKKRARDDDERTEGRPPKGGGDPADEHAPHEESLHEESEAQLVDEMEQRIAELDNRYKRALADYQNSQRRAVENERRARQEGMASVVESLIPVMDHFKLALSIDPASASPEQIFGGVKVILDELTKTLAAYGVAPIEPRPNDEFDPVRHQAMMMTESDEVEPGRIVSVFQAGYALGDRVIRPAKVSVRPADESGGGEGAGDGDGDGDGEGDGGEGSAPGNARGDQE